MATCYVCKNQQKAMNVLEGAPICDECLVNMRFPTAGRFGQHLTAAFGEGETSREIWKQYRIWRDKTFDNLQNAKEEI